MNLKIVELMKQPDRDVAWLRKALQSALELELATLPPYLCGYWALQDSSSDPAKIIYSIVMQEMAHFGLACNMLLAAGGKPDVVGGYGQITYPGPLPGGVVPKCDPKVFPRLPCDPHFQVVLGFADFQKFALMAMQIEYPEDPVPQPARLAAVAETFPSIGEFYDAVREAFELNNKQLQYPVANQQKSGIGVFVIDNLKKAQDAILQIQQQGEGSAKYPYYGDGKLSHFYSFGEIYFGKKYVYDAAKKTGDWTGAPITIPPVYPMTPVPKDGYPGAPTEVIQCDRTFTKMLKQLDDAWAGVPGKLRDAIGSMADLGSQATDLLTKQIARKDVPGIYGPQFKINS